MSQPIEIRIKRGTKTYLAELNPVLDAGEPCLEIDTNRIKYGDGTTPWNLLEYAGGNVTLPGENNDPAGLNAAIGGGFNNTAGGTNSFIGAGANNTAAAANAAVLAGSANTASGQNSAVLSGSASSATAANATTIGKQAVANSYGQLAAAAGCFNVPGDAQFSVYHLRGQTISDTATVLALDGVNSFDEDGISTAKRLELPVGVVWNFDIKVTAYNTTDDLTAVWTIRGGVRRNISGAVSFVGEPVVETTAENNWPTAATVSVRATADDDAEPYTLAVDAEGAAGVTIYWYATALISQLRPKPPLTSDMFVEVRAAAAITSLTCSIANTNSQLRPAFNPTIQDYCIYSAANATDSYTLTINETPITGTIAVNKALHITYGEQEYFIRVIPTDLPLNTITTKTSSYRPGYYLYAPQQGGGGYWYIVFDGNGVPVWYVRDDRFNGLALHYAHTPNKLVLHRWSSQSIPRHVVTLGLNTMSVVGYSMKNDMTNSNPFWECHESHVIAGPPNRKGNFISMTYAHGCGGAYMPNNGLYIQELTPDGQTKVWDWYSDDYFNIGQYFDHFHANSIDVHPVTGDVLLSCRHPGGAFCIDYQTKQVKWALQGVPCCSSGASTFQSVARAATTQNTQWLTITGDPYNGPSGNHDARWHPEIPPLTPGNAVISLYDNHTDRSNYARGVIYEIDLANNQGIFRAHAHSTSTQSPYQGGFTLLKELDGSYSHVANFIYENPSVVEFNNGTNLDPDQNIVFAATVPGNFAYRVVKVRPDQLDINYMRTTAGRVLTTP